jgi:hypothetical protein
VRFSFDEMFSLQHSSPRLVVGVGSLLLAALAVVVAAATPGFPGDVRSWPRTLLARLRTDLPRGDRVTAAWVGLALWSVLVSALHFGGLRYGVYTAVPWWDLLTHAMGGLGVAALLALTHRRTPAAARSPLWLIPSVFAIGAGFEVYEFVFKDFWYGWSVGFYIEDTLIDLAVNTSGAVVVAAAVAGYRSLVGSRGTNANTTGADADDAASGAEPSK